MLNRAKLHDRQEVECLSSPQSRHATKPNLNLKVKGKLFRKAHNKKYIRKNNKISFKSNINNYVKKRPGRSGSIDTQPSTPHNTTQFIVDSGYSQQDNYNIIYEYDMDPVEFNFKHHAMAGSMMSMMQERMNSDNMSSNTEQMSTTAPSLAANEGLDGVNYDRYLEEIGKVENEESLEGIIRGLVNVIKRKDSELISLLSDPKRKDTL